MKICHLFASVLLGASLYAAAQAQQPATGAGDQGAQKQTFLIQGLHCPPCTRTVESSLARTPGVRAARVDWNSKNAWVTFDERDISAQQVAQAISQTPHMMGGGMHYRAAFALRVPGLKDAASGQVAKDALSKVTGVAQVYVYPAQQSVAVDFASSGKTTSGQLIEALRKAGLEASVYR
jgi:cation transport ATPase